MTSEPAAEPNSTGATDSPPAPEPVSVEPWVLADVAYARYYNPHEVLGAHTAKAVPSTSPMGPS